MRAAATAATLTAMTGVDITGRIPLAAITAAAGAMRTTKSEEGQSKLLGIVTTTIWFLFNLHNYVY